jgi:predicted RNA methylase
MRVNGMDTQIDLVQKASTEMQHTDMQASCRANIIVNELYDTELLGEGILPTLRHALDNLAAPDCIVVPAAADVVAVLLQSDDLYPGYHPHGLRPHGHVHLFPESLDDGAAAPASPPAWAKTFVSESMFLDKLVEKGGGRMLSEPALVSTIDFCKPPSHGTHAGEVLSLTVTQPGTLHAIAYWWDLRMCPGDANPRAAEAAQVSPACPEDCALRARARPDGRGMPQLPLAAVRQGKGDRPSAGVLSMAPGEGWRDHWRQNICMLDAPLSVEQGDVVSLRACHDDWRIWFQVCTHLGGRSASAASAQPAPAPADGPAELRLARVLFGGHTLRLLADSERAAAYRRVLATGLLTVHAGTCLTVGDGHWLALAAADAGAARVLDIEASPQALHLASQCFAAARLPPWRVGAFLVATSDSRACRCVLSGAGAKLAPPTRVTRRARAPRGPPAA